MTNQKNKCKVVVQGRGEVAAEYTEILNYHLEVINRDFPNATVFMLQTAVQDGRLTTLIQWQYFEKRRELML